MPDEKNLQKLKEQYPDFFAQFSSQLLGFVFSKETALDIAEACMENDIEEDEQIEKISYHVTLALLDQIPKENLSEVLQKGVRLNREVAEKIAKTIKEEVFARISEMSTEPETRSEEPPASALQKTSSSQKQQDSKDKNDSTIKQSKTHDAYREPIE